ncbi:MAG: hypothetical protein KIS67_07095 [Verrucomicrobiae bacterium]|nr:hypothetical protein [Verrucomicrobiae bacterium]
MSTLLVRAVEWEALPSLPEGSGNFVCGTLKGDLVLLGGIGWKDDVKQWRDTIWRFDTATTQWSVACRLPWPVAYAAFGETREGVYFAGGSDGQKMHNTLHLFNHELELRPVARFTAPLCYSGAAIANGELLVVGGGTDPNDLKTLTNLFYAVNLRDGKTTLLPEYPGGKLLVPGAAVVGQRFYTFGGAAWDSTNSRALNTDSAFAYSLAQKRWQAIKPYPFPVRGLASCVLADRYILLGGGYANAFTDLAVLYDTETNTYLKTQPLPTKAMANFIKASDFVYWVGGEHAMRQRSDAVYRIRWKTLLHEAQRLGRGYSN